MNYPHQPSTVLAPLPPDLHPNDLGVLEPISSSEVTTIRDTSAEIDTQPLPSIRKVVKALGSTVAHELSSVIITENDDVMRIDKLTTHTDTTFGKETTLRRYEFSLTTPNASISEYSTIQPGSRIDLYPLLEKVLPEARAIQLDEIHEVQAILDSLNQAPLTKSFSFLHLFHSHKEKH